MIWSAALWLVAISATVEGASYLAKWAARRHADRLHRALEEVSPAGTPVVGEVELDREAKRVEGTRS